MNSSEESNGQSKGIITLKINNFNQSIKRILSPPLTMYGLDWQISFQFSNGQPSCYLHCNPRSKKNSSWFCYAEFELILVSQKEGTGNYQGKFSKFFSTKIRSWGCVKFATLEQFIDPDKGYIKSGTIILQANIHTASGESAISNLPPASQDPVNLNTGNTCKPFTLTVTNGAGQENAYKVAIQQNELRKAKVLCDVNIQIQNDIFPCHRIVLASACDYFRAFFTNNFVESEKKDVTLQNFAPKTFELVLDFIYTGKICLDHENVYHVLVGSDFLGLKYVEELCIAYLEHHVPNDNIAQLCSFAVQKANVHLMKSVLQPHVKNNFASLLHDLHSLPSYVLIKVLTPDCVKSNTEVVLSFLLKWVKANKETQFVLELLKSVDHLSVDGKTLCEIMTTITEIAAENKKCDDVKSKTVRKRRKRTF